MYNSKKILPKLNQKALKTYSIIRRENNPVSKTKWLLKIWFALIIFFVLLNSDNCFSSTEISNVRYWAAPDHTRIVFDLDGEPIYEVKEEENILILKFTDASFNKSIPAEIILDKPGIKKIIFYDTEDDTVKIEFILDKHLKTDVFKLKKFKDKPQRVVIDIILELPSQEVSIKEQLPKLIQRKIIVIDPGHGGDDPGAVGKRGTYEKNIVLVISREIKKAVNKIPGYRAVLTRDGDYYVSFNKRLQIAKDLEASLFISVHADAARNRNARGSSVYCLSAGAASSEAAKLLANNENLSDIIGGVPNGEGKNESDQIILNMFQTNTINFSKTYASCLIKQLDRVNTVKHKKVQEAPFRVLKLPDIPAVLIETAYISNMQEERLLKTDGFQKKLALAIASSVTEYLSGTASISPANDASKYADNIDSASGKYDERIADVREIKTTSYKIRRGDTLFSVARHFNTKTATLLELNKMKKNDTLIVGRKILVPANLTEKPPERHLRIHSSKSKQSGVVKTSRIYIVKKGDTLFSIAKNNSTTIESLRKINNMRSSDSLLYGQRIKLP
jgi:N-acetylmuramoyl-L-alanine amidase